eukprot:1320740-Pyramimonas_sp.AAC.1
MGPTFLCDEASALATSHYWDFHKHARVDLDVTTGVPHRMPPKPPQKRRFDLRWLVILLCFFCVGVSVFNFRGSFQSSRENLVVEETLPPSVPHSPPTYPGAISTADSYIKLLEQWVSLDKDPDGTNFTGLWRGPSLFTYDDQTKIPAQDTEEGGHPVPQGKRTIVEDVIIWQRSSLYKDGVRLDWGYFGLMLSISGKAALLGAQGHWSGGRVWTMDWTLHALHGCRVSNSTSPKP